MLFQHFLLQAAARHERPVPEYDAARVRQLVGYHWPGNVRELRNVADRCVLGIECGAPPFGEGVDVASRPLAETVEAVERALIVDARRRLGDPHSAGWTAHVTLARRMPTAQVGDALAVIATGPEALRFVTATGLRRWDPDAGVARMLAGHGPGEVAPSCADA